MTKKQRFPVAAMSMRPGDGGKIVHEFFKKGDEVPDRDLGQLIFAEGVIAKGRDYKVAWDAKKRRFLYAYVTQSGEGEFREYPWIQRGAPRG